MAELTLNPGCKAVEIALVYFLVNFSLKCVTYTEKYTNLKYTIQRVFRFRLYQYNHNKTTLLAPKDYPD